MVAITCHSGPKTDIVSLFPHAGLKPPLDTVTTVTTELQVYLQGRRGRSIGFNVLQFVKFTSFLEVYGPGTF